MVFSVKSLAFSSAGSGAFRSKDGRIACHGFEQVYHMTPGQEALWVLVFPTLTEVRWDIGVATGYTGARLRSRV